VSSGPDHLGHLDRDEARATSQVQDACTIGDAGELPPVVFALASQLGHEAIPLDLAVGQRQCIPTELTISHGSILPQRGKGDGRHAA
jgi:hypothetical protein